MSAKWTTSPLSCASSSHGETFASWSSFVTITSSPSAHSRAAVRVQAKLRVVMFWPKASSSGSAVRNRLAVSRARTTSSSVRRLVSYGPLTFAFDVRR